MSEAASSDIVRCRFLSSDIGRYPTQHNYNNNYKHNSNSTAATATTKIHTASTARARSKAERAAGMQSQCFRCWVQAEGSADRNRKTFCVVLHQAAFLLTVNGRFLFAKTKRKWGFKRSPRRSRGIYLLWIKKTAQQCGQIIAILKANIKDHNGSVKRWRL